LAVPTGTGHADHGGRCGERGAARRGSAGGCTMSGEARASSVVVGRARPRAARRHVALRYQ